MMDTLVKYVRDEFRRPFATLVAVKGDDGVKIGAAICNTKDNFQKSLGREIAEGRALKGVQTKVPNQVVFTELHGEVGYHDIAHVLGHEYNNFKERAENYFARVAETV